MTTWLNVLCLFVINMGSADKDHVIKCTLPTVGSADKDHVVKCTLSYLKSADKDHVVKCTLPTWVQLTRTTWLMCSAYLGSADKDHVVNVLCLPGIS